MLLTQVVVILSATEVSLSVAPAEACVSRERLTVLLEKAGCVVVDSPTAMDITVDRDGPDLRVRAIRGPTLLDRRVPLAPDDCPAAERLIAALILAWTRSGFPAAQRDAGAASPPQRSLHPLSGADVRPTPRARSGERDGPTVLVSQPSSDGGFSPTRTTSKLSDEQPIPAAPLTTSVERVLGGRPPAPETGASEDANAGTERSTRDDGRLTRVALPLSLDVTLSGGSGFGPTSTFTAAGELSVALSGPRFGTVIDVGLESARSSTREPATVTTTAQWLSLSGLVQFHHLDRLRLRVGVGARGWRLSATATGVIDNEPQSVLSIGPVAWVQTALRLGEHIHATATVVGATRFRSERFFVAGLGTVLELTPYFLMALIGISIQGFGE